MQIFPCSGVQRLGEAGAVVGAAADQLPHGGRGQVCPPPPPPGQVQGGPAPYRHRFIQTHVLVPQVRGHEDRGESLYLAEKNISYKKNLDIGSRSR